MIRFLFSCVFERGEKTTSQRASPGKTGSIAHPCEHERLNGRQPYPTKKHSALTDDHFSERLSFLIVLIGSFCLLEREHAINNRLQPVHCDGAVHGEKLGS